MGSTPIALRTAAVCAASLLASAGQALAGEPHLVSQPEGETGGGAAEGEGAAELDAAGAAWRFDLNTWVWLVGMDGDVGARGQTVGVSASFSDILDASDSIFAFSGRLEVGKGAWGAFFDGMYSKLGVDDQTGPGGVADVDVTFEMVLIDFGLMYRLGEWEPTGEEAQKNPYNTTLDLYAGARYTNLDLELAPANVASRSASESWFDPIVGAKLILPIAEHWHLRTNGDIGGFGVESDFTWSATGVIGYDFPLFEHPASIYAGYRAIGQDFTEGSGADEFTWDVVQHGPILGFSLLF